MIKSCESRKDVSVRLRKNLSCAGALEYKVCALAAPEDAEKERSAKKMIEDRISEVRFKGAGSSIQRPRS